MWNKSNYATTVPCSVYAGLWRGVVTMKNLLTVAISLTLVACGGGGSSPAPIPLAISTANPVTYYDNYRDVNIDSVAIPFTVIDGYVEGATVFYDFNWNGIQDEGEVSANWMGIDPAFNICVEYDDTGCITIQSYDPPDNYYYFLNSVDYAESELTGYEGEFIDTMISNYTVGCENKFSVIAQVPVGANDSERGYVPTAYEMIYIPQPNSISSTEYGANITPFASMFNTVIANSNIIQYPIAETCSDQSIAQSDNVINKVSVYLSDIQTNFGIDINFFYDDFIASGDTDKQTIAEYIVDVISSATTAKIAVQDSENIQLQQVFSNGTIEQVLGGQQFTTLDFDLLKRVRTDPTQGFQSYQDRRFFGLSLNGSGELYAQDGTVVPINYDNIINNAEAIQDTSTYSKENAFLGVDVYLHTMTTLGWFNSIQDTQTTKEIVYSKPGTSYAFVEKDVGNWIQVDFGDDGQYSFYLMMNSTNPLGNYNASNIITNFDLSTAETLLVSMQTVSPHIDDAEDTIPYAYAGDIIQYQHRTETLVYTYEYNTVSNSENCWTQNRSTKVVTTVEGADALTSCKELF